MPTKQTLRRAAEDKKQGKAATTQAGEFVREQMDKMKKGSGASENRKQAIAIGLSEARRSGVDIPDKPGKPGAKRSGGQAKNAGAKKASNKTAAAKKSVAVKKRTTKSS